MKTLITLVLFALLLAGGYGQNDTTPTETTSETTTSISTVPTETTTVADTTTSVDTTTTSPTTPPTTAAPTTQPSPSPTTPKTSPETTTTSKTSPETTTPSTTTPKPASTTPAPKPPVAELGSWNVTEGNVTCIRADLKIRFMIPVDGREDYIALSPNATAVGSCNSTNGTQELRLEDSDYTLTLLFEKDDKSAMLKNISLVYNLPGDSDAVYNDTGLFKVAVGHSYLCSNTETVPLANVSMEIFQIHLQAFGSAENGDFGTAEECEADDKVDDIVPIAVGCALLALVVIVLVAYFVGRRRSRQKGYQSV